MKNEIASAKQKRLEQSLSQISADVADAVEKTDQAKKLIFDAENVMIHVQRKLEELYITLDDVPSSKK